MIRVRIFRSVDLPAPLRPIDAEHLALANVEAHVPQRPDLLAVARSLRARDPRRGARIESRSVPYAACI